MNAFAAALDAPYGSVPEAVVPAVVLPVADPPVVDPPAVEPAAVEPAVEPLVPVVPLALDRESPGVTVAFVSMKPPAAVADPVPPAVLPAVVPEVPVVPDVPVVPAVDGWAPGIRQPVTTTFCDR